MFFLFLLVFFLGRGFLFNYFVFIFVLFLSALALQVHTDWTHKVRACGRAGSFVSCSSAERDALVVYDADRRASTVFRVHKGVYAFDYDQAHNVSTVAAQHKKK